MKKLMLVTLIAFTVSCKQNPKKKTVAEAKPVDKEWVDIFDGVSFAGWHQFNSSEISDAWTVEDGAMVFNPALKEKGTSNDIMTDSEYTNFELSLEWNIGEVGNSGIFWGVKEGEGFNKPYQTGPEIQVLDNERHPDSFKNPNFHQAGALYDMVEPTQDVCKPAGEWNHVLLSIDYNANKGSVKLNNVEIVTFPLSGPEWDALVDNSKFADWEDFAKYKTGKIGLQDHGDKVSYRNIKIREL